MFNFQSGEITLPKIAITNKTTLTQLLTVLQDEVKTVTLDNPDTTTVFFQETHEVSAELSLLSLEFHKETLTHCTFSAMHIGDDEWDAAVREPVMQHLTQQAENNGGVLKENARWEYPWGYMLYEHDHLIDVYFESAKDRLKKRFYQALAELTSPLFAALLKKFGTPAKVSPMSICMPNGVAVPCVDYENLICASQMPYNDGNRIVLADRRYVLVLQEVQGNYEIVVYKQWNTPELNKLRGVLNEEMVK